MLPDIFSQKFVLFLEKYYEWLNNPENIASRRNIDVEFLTEIWDEFAPLLPKTLHFDQRLVLKHLHHLFREKGSLQGIIDFFKILYGEEITVYYPWKDVVILSDSTWDNKEGLIALDSYDITLNELCFNKGQFKTNKSLLSDTQMIQDSFYWQKFSYDIKSSNPRKKWDDVYQAVMHTAGYKLFNSLFLLVENTVKLPTQDYGLIPYVGDSYRTVFVSAMVPTPELINVYFKYYRIPLNTSNRIDLWRDALWTRDTRLLKDYPNTVLTDLFTENTQIAPEITIN